MLFCTTCNRVFCSRCVGPQVPPKESTCPLKTVSVKSTLVRPSPHPPINIVFNKSLAVHGSVVNHFAVSTMIWPIHPPKKSTVSLPSSTSASAVFIWIEDVFSEKLLKRIVEAVYSSHFSGPDQELLFLLEEVATEYHKIRNLPLTLWWVKKILLHLLRRKEGGENNKNSIV